jgi:hypothetical protein
VLVLEAHAEEDDNESSTPADTGVLIKQNFQDAKVVVLFHN